MGLTSSSPKEQLSQEEQDVKYLGERMPFGDEELWHVYRAYQAMKSKPAEERISFLIDIGVQCAPAEKQEERMVLLQAVEHKLLPPNLGNRLYEKVLLPAQAKSEYVDAGSSSQTTEDSYTRKMKLESFFDGLSDCGRRGNQKALKVLFDCCRPQAADNNDKGTKNFSSSTEATNGMLVDPLELVTMGYRIGLASGFLFTADNAEGQDVSHFFPEDDQGENPESHSGLLALAESLKDFAAKRQQRFDNTATTTPVNHVSEDDVQEWAEQVAPLFGAVLATFVHMLFFPTRPYPPTRTSFDFPSLAEFTSTFVSSGSSSLLFSYGCMSPALGGEVSTVE